MTQVQVSHTLTIIEPNPWSPAVTHWDEYENNRPNQVKSQVRFNGKTTWEKCLELFLFFCPHKNLVVLLSLPVNISNVKQTRGMFELGLKHTQCFGYGRCSQKQRAEAVWTGPTPATLVHACIWFPPLNTGREVSFYIGTLLLAHNSV